MLDLQGFYAIYRKEKGGACSLLGIPFPKSGHCIVATSGYDSRTMKLETTQIVPLTMLDNGAIRITGTRVSLDSIIHHYKLGKTPESIHESFPDVSLSDIHAVIAYYLTHQETVEEYLQQQEIEADAMQQQIETQPGYQEWRSDLRERIQARWIVQQSATKNRRGNHLGE